MRAALEVRRRLLGAEHPDMAQSLSNLVLLRRDAGDYPAAESLERQALALGRRRFGDAHPCVASALDDLAQILRYNGNLAEAERRYREAPARRRVSTGLIAGASVPPGTTNLPRP